MVKLTHQIKNSFFTIRFIYGVGLVVFCFIISFIFPSLFIISQIILTLFIAITITDFLLIHNAISFVNFHRKLPPILNLGNDQNVTISVKNNSNQVFKIEVFDVLPMQLQERNFYISQILKAKEEKKLTYTISPKTRGEYIFGSTLIFLQNRIGLINVRKEFKASETLACYPSIQDMKELELITFSRVSNLDGLKKYRKIGHSYEFDQINPYVKGDDIRSINWKATARHSDLMINQYQDEKSQQVFCIIDKGRSMSIPFNELSLLDYSINATLALSNIILKKGDRAGVISFSNKIGTTLKAHNSSNQLKKILNQLYNEKARIDFESNFDLLYRAVKNIVKRRSLIILFLNFENEDILNSALPILQKINKLHLLTIVMFEDSELIEFCKKEVKTISDIYSLTFTQEQINLKKELAKKLNKIGIQTILTEPKNLSLNTINKYLELKAKGLI